MLYEVHAYELLGKLAVSVVIGETTDEGYSWTKLLLCQDDIPDWASRPWDVIWLLGQRLSAEAIERGGKQ